MFCNICGHVMTYSELVPGNYYCKNCGDNYFDEEEYLEEIDYLGHEELIEEGKLDV